MHSYGFGHVKLYRGYTRRTLTVCICSVYIHVGPVGYIFSNLDTVPCVPTPVDTCGSHASEAWREHRVGPIGT